jgi:hypothetical protein
MEIWQADFYKTSSQNERGEILWLLLICDSQGVIIHEATCPQFQANSAWLVSQLQEASQDKIPDLIQVFRPQSLSLLTTAGKQLEIPVQATRRTPALQEILTKKAEESNYNPIKLDKPPPQMLPENLWGEEWSFGTISAGDLIDFIQDRPIPILEIPDSLFPINLGIASTTTIPGIIIYGGKKSMLLARWLQENNPVSLNYIPTEIGTSGGLVLESGLVDRWIVATFADGEVAQAAQNYQQRKQASQGLHFLLVQPDDSGMTYTGCWLLGEET